MLRKLKNKSIAYYLWIPSKNRSKYVTNKEFKNEKPKNNYTVFGLFYTIKFNLKNSKIYPVFKL